MLGQAAITEVLIAGGALLLSLPVGVVAHELTHALVLRWLGVPFDVEWLPDRDDRREATSVAGATSFGRWASVTPRRLPRELPPWGLRLAAIAPLSMAIPMALVLLGVLPDPLRTGNTPLIAATIAWFGCAIPSPQDFSLFWYADRVLTEYGEEMDG